MPVDIPEYLMRMVRRSAPLAEVVSGTTPVLSFGDARHAEVATLGINPSRREFVENGRLLTGPERRLATLASLGAEGALRLTREQITTVINDCAAYFRRNPYRQWFDPLDKILQAALGVSYYDGTACHLDLVQWATDPVWGELDNRSRQLLLRESLPHLQNQLRLGNIRLVVLNGRQVLDYVLSVGLARLNLTDTLRVGNFSSSLYFGEADGVRFMGWSANLQSSYGVSLEFKSQLVEWLANTQMHSANKAENHRLLVQPHQSGTDPADAFDTNGHIIAGTKVTGKAGLFQLLKAWLEVSRAQTIGDIGTYGRRPCIFIALDVGGSAVLNSDTKRAAVEEFLDTSVGGASETWSIVPNRRGRVNKVTFGADGVETPGWYCYLRDSLDKPQKI